MATTAETLRLSARVIENQPHLRIGAVTAIRIAAGVGRAAHEHAEQTISVLAERLGYGGYRDLAAQVERWSHMCTPAGIVAGLRAAADAEEEGA